MKNVKIMGMGVALALMALWAKAQSGPVQLQPSSGGGIATINGFGTNVTLVGTTTNNSVITNSAPMTFSGAINRAWVTFGPTNTGFGITGGELAAFNQGAVIFQSSLSGNQRWLQLAGNADSSQSQFRFSDFGPAFVEGARQGLLVTTNRWGAVPVTNQVMGNLETRPVAGLGGGLAFYRTNAWTAADLGTNGSGLWRSNDGPNAVNIYISVNSAGSVTNWLVPVTK